MAGSSSPPAPSPSPSSLLATLASLSCAASASACAALSRSEEARGSASSIAHEHGLSCKPRPSPAAALHPHPVPPVPPPPQPNDLLGFQPNDLARAQLEDWLSKALLEIDELKAERDALRQQSPRGHVRRTSDLFSPPAPQAPEPQDSPPQDSPRPSPISTSVSFAPDPDFYDDDPDDDPDTSLAALGRSILASRLSPRAASPRAASPRADPPRSPSWPNPGTHRFNQHVVGPGVARSVLGMLRRTAASLEALAAGRQDDGPPPPEPVEGGNNVDLEAEVASFVDAVEGLFRDKCEELENLKELTKFIEANVVEKK